MWLRLIVIVCLFVPNIKAQESPQTSSSPPEAPYIDHEERQISFYPGGKIEVLAGVPGNLKIIGWQKGSIRLEAEKIVHHLSPESAKALLEKSPIRVRYNQTSATIRTTGSAVPPATIKVNLTLYVPGEKTDMSIKMDQGDISIDSVNGWVEATAREGSLEVNSMAGYFSASTQRGDIRVAMSGVRWRGLEFAALTQRGSVSLKLPAKYSAALQLETREGKVVVDYPPRVVEGESVPPEIVIRKKGQSLKGAVGDGGAPIKLATYCGDVILSLAEEK